MECLLGAYLVVTFTKNLGERKLRTVKDNLFLIDTQLGPARIEMEVA